MRTNNKIPSLRKIDVHILTEVLIYLSVNIGSDYHVAFEYIEVPTFAKGRLRALYTWLNGHNIEKFICKELNISIYNPYNLNLYYRYWIINLIFEIEQELI
jgi:hypothetical protein